MNEMNLTPLARKLRRNQTEAERVLWNHLKNRQLQELKFRRQYQLGKYIVDFICIERKYIIKLDGGQHNEEKYKQDDLIRTHWLIQHGFTIIRFWDDEVLRNIDGVLEKIQTSIPSP